MFRFAGQTSFLAALVLLWACAQQPVTPGKETTRVEAPVPAPSGLDGLPPGERYWQLKFMMGLTGGVDGALLDALEARYGAPGDTVPAIPDVAAYQGAGYRIASAESILEGVTDLAAFRRVAGDDIRAELARLEREYPELVAGVDAEILAEEILLVRSAVQDSLEALAENGDLPGGAALAPYREGTLRARNELEYVVFSRQMDSLADRSIDEATGRLDAFHRMLDDGEDAEFLRERILAAEEMNRQLTREHRQYATQRTVRTVIFLLPAISRYFRYR